MQWTDEAIVLATRAHGETSAVAELFTKTHGRYLGLVRGGRSRRMRPVLQTGNIVVAQWRARLSEHLGSYSIELLEPHAARVIHDRPALAGLDTLMALSRLLPERDPHSELYDATKIIIAALSEGEHWPALLVRWEMALLDELGFGLDLSTCASTGATSDLVYVSPKSGRAVSREAGEPYIDKLLALPAFLNAANSGFSPPGRIEILEAYRLTAFFFERHIWGPRGIKPPQSRDRLVASLSQQ